MWINLTNNELEFLRDRAAFNDDKELSEVIERLVEDSEVKANDTPYIETCRDRFNIEGLLETDDDPVVIKEDGGAKVMCWRFVSDSDVSGDGDNDSDVDEFPSEISTDGPDMDEDI